MYIDKDLKLLDDEIIVRFEPSIYAFSTNTQPNYLKVGDTTRAVDIRIAEWDKLLKKRLYPKLVTLEKQFETTSKVSDELYFRDYAVHSYIKEVLKKGTFTDEKLLSLYSEEFFKDVSVTDVQNAINDIIADANSDKAGKKYIFYKISEKKRIDFHYKNDKDWRLRPNQKEVVKNFQAAKDEKLLLMYAVMRFGKSFTAMSCALESGAEKVLIVSSKADVLTEWKKTVEMPICFKEYLFICDDDLKRNIDIDTRLKETKKSRVVYFLTLQNLIGKSTDGNNIKERLKSVFDTEFDLIIVDETHTGAWAEIYGKPISDEEDGDYLKAEVKENEALKTKITKLKTKKKLHLSGTPYNLLMDNKFNAKNIIATCQFKDILQDKQKWDADNFEKIENNKINIETGKPYQEWDNPYFGFPKMLRFAFNLPKKARQELESKKDNTYSLSSLFDTKGSGNKRVFKHEEAVLNLLKVIDGTEQDEQVLSFLNVDKIKDNNVCKHMIFALPWKKSCDAMELLLKKDKQSFINLSKYNVLKITGEKIDNSLDTVDKVKSVIENFEKNGKKTITLTVNRMLTGVTVKEWDTMVMLKNTKSAQEYDQAAFRIQNQYVLEYEASDGSILKKDMKPQTILVDFDPVRMLEIQGLSTRIANNVTGTETTLEESVSTDLKYFPIIVYNANKLVKVEPNNLIEIIMNYNNKKSIMDETQIIDFDKKLLDVSYIAEYINAQSKGSFSNKLQVEANHGEEESDFEQPPADETNDNEKGNTKKIQTNSENNSEKEQKILEQKYRMCIAKIAFYTFLTDSNIDTLRQVLLSVEKENIHIERNRRLFKNLQLDKKFIQAHLDNSIRNTTLNIDTVIAKANILSQDKNLSPVERANNALNRFSRISESEIVTPVHICCEMCNSVGLDNFIETVAHNGRILDIASKTGEFTFAIYQLLKDKVEDEELKKAIYAIPTSSVTYEFTRKIFEILNLPLENIATEFNTYDLLKVRETKDEVNYEKIKNILLQNKAFNKIKLTDEVGKGDDKLKFDIIVGNPPYMETDKDDGKGSASPLYNLFIDSSKKIQPNYISLITPSVWFLGGKGLDNFRQSMLKDIRFKKFVNYITAKDVFNNVNLRGGVNYFLWEQEYDNTKNNIEVVEVSNNEVTSREVREYAICGLNLFIADNVGFHIIKRMIESNIIQLNEETFKNMLSDYVSERNPFGYSTTFKKFENYNSNEQQYKIYLPKKKHCYVNKTSLEKGFNLLDKVKVITPFANNIGTDLPDDNLNTQIIFKDEVVTETYLVIGADLNLSVENAKNLEKYLKTKFVRYLISLAKANQNGTRQTYRFVPLQNFTEKSDINWSTSISEIDKQLYKKYNLTPVEIDYIESKIKPM